MLVPHGRRDRTRIPATRAGSNPGHAQLLVATSPQAPAPGGPGERQPSLRNIRQGQAGPSVES